MLASVIYYCMCLKFFLINHQLIYKKTKNRQNKFTEQWLDCNAVKANGYPSLKLTPICQIVHPALRKMYGNA